MGTSTKNQSFGNFLDHLYDQWELLKIIAECLKEEGLSAIVKDNSPLWVASPKSGTLPPEIVIIDDEHSFTLQHEDGILKLWVRGPRIGTDDNKVYMKRRWATMKEPIIIIGLSDPECFKKIAEKIK